MLNEDCREAAPVCYENFCTNCENNRDCNNYSPNIFCIDQVCVECGINSDCSGQQVCEKGKCVNTSNGGALIGGLIGGIGVLLLGGTIYLWIRINRKHFKSIPVPRDGNCLFHSFAYCFNQDYLKFSLEKKNEIADSLRSRVISMIKRGKF